MLWREAVGQLAWGTGDPRNLGAGARQWVDDDHGHSPYTAMVLVSCRMALPAETCTVMVFIPSEVNLNDMLPSKVIKG